MIRYRQTICVIAALGALTGCDRGVTIRHYTEISRSPDARADRSLPAMPSAGAMPGMTPQDPAMMAMLDESVAAVDLRWARPDGWSEQPGAGMRLVTFMSQEQDPVTCTVISLAGMSGGIEANVQRWAGQLNLAAGPDALAEFMSAQKTITVPSGIELRILDFRQLQPQAAADTPSMMAAIVALPGKSVFIKMTGSFAAVGRNHDAFLQLLKSLEVPVPE